MLLAYVDESYTDSDYWMAALICSEDVLVPLTESLDSVVNKAAASYRDVSELSVATRKSPVMAI